MRKFSFADIIAALFILLFVYAAVSKLADYAKFRVQLAQSPLLTAFAGWVAWMIPGLELMIAVALFMDRYRLAALYASFGLMVMFSTYIIIIRHFSEYVPCSCGGILQHMNWDQHFWFNLAFVLLAAAAIIVYPRPVPPAIIASQRSST